MTGFAPAPDGTFYVTDMMSQKMYHVDATLSKVLHQAGGLGKGPGEFGGMVMNIALIDGVVYVFTMDTFVHRFDGNLKYLGREFTRATVSSAAKLGDGRILAYTSNGTLMNEPDPPAYFSMEVFKADFSGKMDGIRFDPVRSFPQTVYGAGFMGKLGSSYAVAYFGLNIVDLFGADGKKLKTLELSQWDQKPGTMKLPVADDVVARMKALGFTQPDAMPDGNVVHYVTGDGPYVVVLGGKYAPEPQKSIAVINEKHEVSYAVLERRAEQIFVRGDILYAVEKDSDDVYTVAKYKLGV